MRRLANHRPIRRIAIPCIPRSIAYQRSWVGCLADNIVTQTVSLDTQIEVGIRELGIPC